MGSGTVPPDLLVKPAQLSRFGVPSAFLGQFLPRALNVQIVTGGALGTATWQWKWLGDAGYTSSIYATSDVTPWTFTLDDAFADLTFAAHTYVANTVYTVDEAGTVTGGAELTCARFDLRQNACSASTTEAMMLMRDAIRPPLTAWGDDATAHAAAMSYAWLKRAVGATPQGAGLGDENVFLAETAARAFFMHIGENGKPDSMTDTSPTIDGPLIPIYPIGDALRGY